MSLAARETVYKILKSIMKYDLKHETITNKLLISRERILANAHKQHLKISYFNKLSFFFNKQNWLFGVYDGKYRNGELTQVNIAFLIRKKQFNDDDLLPLKIYSNEYDNDIKNEFTDFLDHEDEYEDDIYDDGDYIEEDEETEDDDEDEENEDENDEESDDEDEDEDIKVTKRKK